MKQQVAERQKDRVLRLIKNEGVFRPRDLKSHDISTRQVYRHINRLLKDGQITRVGRGLYVAADANLTEHITLAEVCKHVPHAVVCLLSALRFHNLTTQAPNDIWIAIGEKAWPPKEQSVRLRVFRFSGRALTSGVQTVPFKGVKIRVYNPAKTVADCFKYRNKVGLDVAVEALRDCWRDRKATADELRKYAKTCRVESVMRPYMESVIWE
jgi:predicted transcriptional regulator of viral defense system